MQLAPIRFGQLFVESHAQGFNEKTARALEEGFRANADWQALSTGLEKCNKDIVIDVTHSFIIGGNGRNVSVSLRENNQAKYFFGTPVALSKKGAISSNENAVEDFVTSLYKVFVQGHSHWIDQARQGKILTKDK